METSMDIDAHGGSSSDTEGVGTTASSSRAESEAAECRYDSFKDADSAIRDTLATAERTKSDMLVALNDATERSKGLSEQRELLKTLMDIEAKVREQLPAARRRASEAIYRVRPAAEEAHNAVRVHVRDAQRDCIREALSALEDRRKRLESEVKQAQAKLPSARRVYQEAQANADTARAEFERLKAELEGLPKAVDDQIRVLTQAKGRLDATLTTGNWCGVLMAAWDLEAEIQELDDLRGHHLVPATPATGDLQPIQDSGAESGQQAGTQEDADPLDVTIQRVIDAFCTMQEARSVAVGNQTGLKEVEAEIVAAEAALKAFNDSWTDSVDHICEDCPPVSDTVH
jgi:hypothetical protein